MNPSKDAIMARPVTDVKPPKWYRSGPLPLLPAYRHRKADKHNTSAFHFDWLVFRFWTLDTFRLGAEIEIQLDQCYFRLFAPYCTFGVFIPLLSWRYAHAFNRKPKGVL